MGHIALIDNCTRYCYVYLLNGKDEAIETYWQYKTEVENQLDKKIVMIRSGRCGEYESSFAEIYLENGIIHQITAHSHLNLMKLLTGKNRTLKEMLNVLFISSGLPQNLWVVLLL